ncbi:alpha/beta fold hydrolase [Streptomyces sp. NPDC092296]|uniref:alpha/beta fold hydrolase n=1 Tax=Streptomyces sp. NPDC092296 TaxID=3366012 RepID=UPI0038043276
MTAARTATTDTARTATTATRPLPPAPGVTHRFVTADGIRFHVAEAGEGEPVLLLHSFPQHWYAWHHLLPLLAADHRLICPDLRGSGWSDAPPHGYDTDTRVTDVLALMDTLDLDRVRLIGHEWGSWLGFMLCLRAPGRFSHHLALNITHPWPLHRRLLPNAWRYWHTAPLETPLLGRRLLRHSPGFTRQLLRRGTADPAVWSPEELDEYARSTAEPAHARAAEQLHRAYALHDIPRLVRGRYRRQRLTTPTVILAGERDATLPPSVLAGADRHTDRLRVQVIPGAGHLLHQERPDLVAEAAGALFHG